MALKHSGEDADLRIMRTRLSAVGVAALTVGLVAGTGAGPVAAGDFGFVASGQVVKTTDGDSFFGRISRENYLVSRIRLSGVQAMEKGECHYAQASRGLHRLLPNRTAVTVKARFQSSHVPNPKEPNRPRPLRLAFNHKGQDVQYEMLRQGLVLPNLVGRETMNQALYWQVAQQAAAAGVGIWDTDSCQRDAAQTESLRLMVNYNADGNDKQNPNGKYARVVNEGPTTVSLGGWHLRTARHAEVKFPAGTSLAPGGELLVFQGRGQDSVNRFYWGNGNTEGFPNPQASRYRSAGAYLVDPDGDFRAWTMYPCQVACENPLSGKVEMTVIYDPEGNAHSERAEIRNISDAPVALDYHVIEVGDAEVLEFPAGTTLNPGEVAVVHVGQGNATRLDHYLGRTGPILSGRGGMALLRTHESIRVTCYAWGSDSC